MRAVKITTTMLIASLLLVVELQPVAASGGGAIVATQNMDEGTDFGPLLGATSLSAFLAAIDPTWQEVQASNIPERAASVAREIALLHPDLVGLQEVSRWDAISLATGAEVTQIDALAALQGALAQQGAHYAAVATTTESTFNAPDYAAGVFLTVTDFDVILARTDIGGALSIANVRTQHFATNLVLQTPVGPIPVYRGWASADVTLRGRSFRFITTHLEANSTAVQVQQAAELASGPANTTLPVILAGDLNSAAAGGPDPRDAYNLLSAGGFADAWSATNPGGPGYTWPLHGEDPFTPIAEPTERIDLILTKGSITPLFTSRFGNTPAFLTSSGLWPSDHAGVVGLLGG